MATVILFPSPWQDALFLLMITICGLCGLSLMCKCIYMVMYGEDPDEDDVRAEY